MSAGTSAAGAATGAITLCMDAFWISPYAFACFVALREKGVPFDVSEVRLQGGEQREPAYRARAWTGRIPALGHGDFWLTESSAIVEYVEEAFPPPAHARLFPEAREARARARQLLSWLRSDETLPVRDERSAEVIFYDRPRPPLGPKAAAAAGKAVALAERFLDGNGANLFGAWSIADAELAFFLHRMWHDHGLLPSRLRDYAGAQWRRPSVAEYVAHVRPEFVPYG